MNAKNIALSSLVALAAFSSSAFAAGFVPESGNVPAFSQPVMNSNLTRAEVERQAALTPPAAGQQDTVALNQRQPFSSTLTRAEVARQAALTPPAAGQQDTLAQAPIASRLTRAQVRAQLMQTSMAGE